MLSEALIHRYFPEWADRPVREGTPPESERNSYSAGGYAEEFGYSWQSGLPAPPATFEADPEGSRQWRAFIGCLHPGYPECPKPFAHDGYGADPYASDAARASIGARAVAHQSRRSGESLPSFNVVRVDAAAHRKVHGGAVRLWRVFRIRLRAL